jgi:hypothetical protein
MIEKYKNWNELSKPFQQQLKEKDYTVFAIILVFIWVTIIYFLCKII